MNARDDTSISSWQQTFSRERYPELYDGNGALRPPPALQLAMLLSSIPTIQQNGVRFVTPSTNAQVLHIRSAMPTTEDGHQAAFGAIESLLEKARIDYTLKGSENPRLRMQMEHLEIDLTQPPLTEKLSALLTSHQEQICSRYALKQDDLAIALSLLCKVIPEPHIALASLAEAKGQTMALSALTSTITPRADTPAR